MKKFVFVALVFALAFQLPVRAAYLANVPQTLTQPDGTILKCFATGDEYHNWLHDANNFTILQDPVTGFYVYAAKSGTKLVPTAYVAGRANPAALGLQPGLNLDPEEVRLRRQTQFQIPKLKGATGSATTGTINNIVIFIRFSDQAEYTSSTSYYSNAFNSTGDVSMTEYFKEVSANQLTINTSLYPESSGTVVSYQDPQPRNYYCKYDATTNPTGYQDADQRRDREMTLLKDATNSVSAAIVATGLDFDGDNDGRIDNVCYIVQGAVAAWADLLWPHMWALYSYDVKIGTARVWDFNFQLSNSFGVSVLCHEMSHSIGYPDLYRYDNKDINPVGPWDIMASNSNPPQHQSAYTKMKYGQWFSSLPVISAAGTYTLEPLSTNPFAAYKILSPNSSSEFFVVEYRREAGSFEQGLPASGLIISRVNSSLGGNSGGPPDEVYVYRPNGTTTVNGDIYQAYFSAGSGRTSFTATSNPSCFLSNGNPGGIEITNITAAGETISFDYKLAGGAPVLSVTPLTRDVVAAGGTTTFAVSNSGSGTMTWTATVATEAASWLHITSGGSGTNSGTINVTADANGGGSPRTGNITITSAGTDGSPKTVSVVQAANPPVLTVLPASRSIDFAGSATTFEVTNTGGGTMAWTAAVTTGPTWIHITSGTSGSNTGTINVTVDANPDNAVRNGVITVTAAGASGSPKTVTIAQAANPPVLNVLPASRSVSYPSTATTFEVTNTGGGTMAWTAEVTTGPSWIHITSGASGSNAGTINVTIDANNDGSSRNGIITVSSAGATGSPKTVAIEQAGNPPVLSVGPDTQNITFNGGATTFAVSNTGGGSMAWTAAVTTGSAWVHITSGASGTNAGTITVSVDINPDNAERTGVITVTAPGASDSPKTVSVKQAANPPVINVFPTSRAIGYPGASTSFEVTNTGGGTMAWTAAVTTGPSWIHINTGATGSNTGTINVTVDASNSSSERTGAITVTSAGATGSPVTLTIQQAGNPPVLNLGPDSQSMIFAGGVTTFAVSNTGGGELVWTASVTAGSSWAHITSGESGTNTGTITVTADNNPENAERTAIITVNAPGATGSPKTVSVIQAANPPVLNALPSSRSIEYVGASTSFDISNTGGGTLAWTAVVTTGASWVHIIAGAAGSNTGTISIIADPNADNAQRTGIITVTAPGATDSPKTLSVIQAGNVTTLTVGPDVQTVPFAGASTTFAVANTGGGSMVWTAAITSGSSWAHITSGASGTNSGAITVSADPNPDNSPRTAQITVTAPGAVDSPRTVSVVQQANPPVLNVLPASRLIDFAGASTSFEVANNGGGAMNWSAAVTTGSSWIHFTSGSSGTNAGNFEVTIDLNPEDTERTGNITVTAAGATDSPRTVTIVQAANPPVLNVLPLLREVSFLPDTITFDVSNTGGGTMNWSASIPEEINWARIISGSPGINSGTVLVEVDKNFSDSRRTLEMIIAINEGAGTRQTVSIHQEPHSSGISLWETGSGFTVYPNPSDGYVSLHLSDYKGNICRLEVLDMIGQTLLIQTIDRETSIINLTGFTHGIYFFKLTNENGTAGVMRVVRD